MSYYPRADSHKTDKVQVILDLSNHATNKGLELATGIDTFDLVAKKILPHWNWSWQTRH